MKRTPGWRLKKNALHDPAMALGIAAAVLFFLSSGSIAYVNLQTISNDSDKIEHSHSVIVALGQVLSSAEDAETGQRGFLLTGKDNYLDPYTNAATDLPAEIENLARLTSDNPAQQQRIELLKTRVAAKLAELKQTIDLRLAHDTVAALAIVDTDRGKLEMDAIRDQLAAIARAEDGLRQERLGEMAAAHERALSSGILSGLVGIILTLVLGYLVNRGSVGRKRQNWLQSGQVSLASVMRGDQSPSELGSRILSFLAIYLGAAAGAIFVKDGSAFHRKGAYGVPADASVPQSFQLGEGLLGQAAAENRVIAINAIPDGYLAFTSALGRGKPRHLLIVPGIIESDVNTVIELGFVNQVDESVLTILHQMSAAIAVAFRSAKYRHDLSVLLEDTQQKSEALQVQGEELRVSNEELEEQSRALKESQARLELQQAELEQTNSQLEEQAQQLESHRDELETVNSSLQTKARELEQATRYKSDFLANMSHELRTPLNSLLILAKLLSDNRDSNLTDEQVKFAETIRSSGNDLLNLINDILDLSKIEAGHVAVKTENWPLQQIIGNLEQLFDPIAKQKNVDFFIRTDSECPPSIVTDPQRLEQILKNLLSNAFKFTDSGSVTLMIERKSDRHIVFAVSDTGIGIAKDQHRRIFEAFHQADGTISRRYGGTGLGLSISRELATLIGGELTVSSELGLGSTFSVTLPENYSPESTAPDTSQVGYDRRLDSTPSSIEPQATPANRPTITDDRESLQAGRRILLIVEDDEQFAGILRDLAREMGFETLIALTAGDAVTLARQFLPSAVILDVRLPDESGLSVLDRLKRDNLTRHIPIHIVSATDHTQTALSLGATGYMLKPVNREQLADVLTKLEDKFSHRLRRILIVEDDATQREAVGKLLTSHDVETVAAGTAAECLDLLKTQTFDCMVLDLSLPDASGYSLLETLSRQDAYSFPPAIVYTGRELSSDDEQRLRRYSQSIIIKGAKSPERLLDEVTLFLHQVVSKLPEDQQKIIGRARGRDSLLEGRRILIVEDDVRNVYALTAILEPRGAVVEIARNGREALGTLERFSENPALTVDLVLMDVMMPIMDGLTATQEIRKHTLWKSLPIIMLTAKAMPDDQKRCIDAGASDYMAKPLDPEKLLSLVRVWMPR